MGREGTDMSSLIIVAVVLLALTALDGSLEKLPLKFWLGLSVCGYALYRMGIVSVALPSDGGRSRILSAPSMFRSVGVDGKWIALIVVIGVCWWIIGGLFKEWIGKSGK